MWTTNHLVNHVTRPLLRGRLGRRLGRHLALLRVRGRRSDRVYELPVQYAREDETVWIMPGAPDDKSWWRNLRGEGAPVELRLAGEERRGHAAALEGALKPVEVARGVDAYLRAFPRAWRAVSTEDGAPALSHVVMVRVDLAAAAG